MKFLILALMGALATNPPASVSHAGGRRADLSTKAADADDPVEKELLDAACGAHVGFRICETPVFVPKELVETMIRAGEEIILQLTADPRHLSASDRAIPGGFNAPGQTDRPLFVAIDFGITRDPQGDLRPV